MRTWIRLALAGAAVVATGCGDTAKDATSESRGGSGGGSHLSAGGSVVSASGSGAASGGGGRSASGSPPISEAGATSAGTAGTRAGTGGSGGAPVCTPIAHARPSPGAATKSFDELAPTAVGIYEIDDTFVMARSCDQMCPSSDTVGDGPFAHHYVQIVLESARLRALSCKSVAECEDDTKYHGALSVFDSAIADDTLSLENAYIQLPNGMTCTGGTVDSKLYLAAAGKIRLDLEQTLKDFPAYFDAEEQLYGCSSGDAINAVRNEPCNGLSVIEATKVK